jgi:hypothetical protein
MALVKCKECGKETSTEAKTCPSCGIKNPEKIPWGRKPLGKKQIIIVLVIGVAGLVGIIGNNSNEADSEKAKISKMMPEERCSRYEHRASYRAEALVKERLKAPSTAKFPSSSEVSFSLDDSGNCIYEVRSYVDAQNSFGAQIRTDYYVRLKWESAADKWYLLDIRM